MPIDGNALKRVMRRYATGVMVLTLRDGAGFHAVTVNSVTSVSLEPALVLVCMEKNARSHELLNQTKSYALNILTEVQAEAGKAFAYDRVARTEPLDHVAGRVTPHGELIVDNALAWMECRVVAEYPGGDHTIFLSEVVEAGTGAEEKPLIYYETKWLQLNV